MRTARSLPYGGVSFQWGISVRGDLFPEGLCPGGLPDRDPPSQTEWHTGVKALSSRNFVCGR